MSYPFRVTEATVDVIEALLSGDEELYGLKIAKMTGRPSGSVVPILMRLEGCGWVLSEWEQDDTARGPRRRFYRLHADHAGEAASLVRERKKAPRKVMSAILRPGIGGAR
ncbi:helix-turn-helix transcriptional regulator [Streptomyces lancefieldiae]|uniref:Helix-turn-helix transcriptional regulator n=1 Tax=Streptomyces lancefieldiae TaxID=3075520 RepID=A0ABU3B249_9ACTN|nr:helix-turn-helix transcriptional regulator [Streptomyces sp. DSM 40712]MDT0616145.1 helix-turn-helix transcriptional regulator [Streptomyces sp. DSM 40712]